VFELFALAGMVTAVPDRTHEPWKVVGTALCTEAKPNGVEVKAVPIEKVQVFPIDIVQEPANLLVGVPAVD
jgi:hypothetical protein